MALMTMKRGESSGTFRAPQLTVTDHAAVQRDGSAAASGAELGHILNS